MSSEQNSSPTPAVPDPAPAVEASASPSSRPGFSPWLLLAVLAIALAAWQWLETRQRLLDVQQEVARRLADADSAGKAMGGAQNQLREQLDAVQGKVGGIESRLAEIQGQGEALNNLYQELAQGREEARLFEVEQAVALAAQQLQLAGNVQAAVLALQTADAQLARLDRPQYLPLRKALAKDIALLTALPLVDVSGISVRLEQAIAGIDKLPLAPQGHVPLAVSTDTAEPEKVGNAEAAAPQAESGGAAPRAGLGEPGAEPAPTPWWQQAWLQQTWRDLWQEVKGLVRIQRFDGQEPVLLAPEQGYFLRENIKLRLLSARLALLAHDQWTFRNALNEADKWLQRYFVADDASVQALRAQLQKMVQAELVLELPTLGDSLRAVQSLRQGKGAA